MVDHRLDRLCDLRRAKRQPAHAVVADRIDEELGAHELQQLSKVHLRDEHLVVAAQDLARVARERIEVAQVRVRDRAAAVAHTPARRRDRAVRATPAEHEHRRVAVGIVDLELRDVARDAGDLLRAQARHQIVVVGVVRDVAGAVGLLEAADAVLEARRAGHGPRPRERLLVAEIRQERPFEFGSVANVVEMSGSDDTSGRSQGSEPFARYASESR